MPGFRKRLKDRIRREVEKRAPGILGDMPSAPDDPAPPPPEAAPAASPGAEEETPYYKPLEWLEGRDLGPSLQPTSHEMSRIPEDYIRRVPRHVRPPNTKHHQYLDVEYGALVWLVSKEADMKDGTPSDGPGVVSLGYPVLEEQRYRNYPREYKEIHKIRGILPPQIRFDEWTRGRVVGVGSGTIDGERRRWIDVEVAALTEYTLRHKLKREPGQVGPPQEYQGDPVAVVRRFDRDDVYANNDPDERRYADEDEDENLGWAVAATMVDTGVVSVGWQPARIGRT